MSKSHVTLEQHICVVCGHPFDTGTILLDTKLRERFEMHTPTGYSMCPEHKKQADEGYIALVECDPSKTQVEGDRIRHVADAYRTGTIAHLKKDVWDRIFNIPVPDKMVAFVEPDVIRMLRTIQRESQQ
jgi:hypothetical protein